MKQNNEQPEKTKNEKKPFNKKIWREKKYSKKYKLEKWEENRRKAVLRNYYKDLKKETPEMRATVLKDAKKETGKKPINKSAFQLAKEEYAKIKANKEERRQEMERQKAERKKAIINNKAKRMEQMKKLSKKNKKGQPVMKERLEMLLEKIQKGSNK